MRFYQKVKPFFFKENGENLQRSMDPIKLSHHADIVERIYARYPYLDKTSIAHIVIATLEVSRILLLKGCILNLIKFVMDCKLHFFQHVEDGIAYPSVKIRTSTPLKWKKRKNLSDDTRK